MIVVEVEVGEPNHLCGPDCPCWDAPAYAEIREILGNAGALD